MFSVLRDRDLLVHHPYESFSSSTEEFIEQAATDKRVQGIKITLYRTSGDSPIARSLIKAAEMGKQVVAMIELTARFDEATNVTWAKELVKNGHIIDIFTRKQDKDKAEIVNIAKNKKFHKLL